MVFKCQNNKCEILCKDINSIKTKPIARYLLETDKLASGLV